VETLLLVDSEGSSSVIVRSFGGKKDEKPRRRHGENGEPEKEIAGIRGEDFRTDNFPSGISDGLA
jgi:hypothetical protein